MLHLVFISSFILSFIHALSPCFICSFIRLLILFVCFIRHAMGIPAFYRFVRAQANEVASHRKPDEMKILEFSYVLLCKTEYMKISERAMNSPRENKNRPIFYKYRYSSSRLCFIVFLKIFDVVEVCLKVYY